MTSDQPHQRRIVSFVRREGRLTPAQQRALDELYPRWGIAPGDSLLDLDAIFGRHAPRILEIGIGNGEALIEMASGHPENDYLGIEVHRPGVGRVLNRIEEEGLGNVRVICEDAIEVLSKRLPNDSLERVLLFFPDPWHKKKHHKRRIVNAVFAQLVRLKLRPGGCLHMATDWQDYAEHMMDVMTRAEGFENVAGEGEYVVRPDSRPLTRFEQRGHQLGHAVWDMIFEKVS